MSIKVVKGELQKSVDAYLAGAFAAGYMMGLFQNDITPDSDTVIGDLDVADFGGYSGEQALPEFDSSTWVAPRATATAADVTWTADGGSSNNIYGYYVVDDNGDLAWADRNADGPLAIGSNGQRYVVTPQFTRRSEF